MKKYLVTIKLDNNYYDNDSSSIIVEADSNEEAQQIALGSAYVACVNEVAE